MSLLMDALKRAETSKQEAARALTGGDASAPQGGKLVLEPLATGRPAGAISPLPELATHLQAVDADLAFVTFPEASNPPRAKQTPPPVAENKVAQADREAVRNAFQAKITAEPPAKRGLWLALGTLAIAALAIATYVWYQLNGMSGNALTPTNSPPPLSASATSALPTQSPPAIPTNPTSAAPIFTPSSPSTAAIDSAAAVPSLFSPPRREEQPHAPIARIEEAPGLPIRLTRTRPDPDANLLRGHSNIQRNELELARRDFEQSLQRDPNNTDALLALAAIAQRQGRPVDAERLNQQALIANPGDAAVQAAALSGSLAGADPQTTESRLKTLLTAQPESAPLNFTLGNLYARQKRWSEAQQVYFNAVAADSDHPDYLFNLAVSLDHLRQSRPAAQHYRLALEAADKRPAAFDREQVKKRLAELAAGPQP